MKALSIDLGGSHAAVAVVEDRRILRSREIPADSAAGLAPVLPKLKTILDELLREEGFLASLRGSGSWTALPAGHPMPTAGLSPFATDRGGVIDLGVAAMDPARRRGPRLGAVRLARRTAVEVPTAGPDHLGARG